MKKHPTRSEAETLARPYLTTVIDECAKQDRRPSDFVLLIGKYNPAKSVVMPRSECDELLAMAKNEGRRAKLQFLLDKPCEPAQLLVLVMAGDQIEGDLIRIPTLARGADSAKKFGISPKERKQIDDYIAEYGPAIAATIGEEGGRLEDYIAIARPPKDPPAFLPRGAAALVLERQGFGPVIGELDAPRKEDELLVFYKIAGHPSWSRIQFTPAKRDPEKQRRIAATRRLYGPLQSLLKSHAYSTVTEMISAGQKLEDHVVLFASGDGPPEVLAREQAWERFGSTPWRATMDDSDRYRTAESLVVLWEQEGVPMSHCFEVRGPTPSSPKPPLHISVNDWGKLQRDRELLGTAARRLQRLLYPPVREIGAGSFVVFWPVIDEKPPTLLLREEAGDALGAHAKWPRILPHLFVPTDDMLVVADVGGDDVLTFARDADWIHPPPPPWRPWEGSWLAQR